MKLFTHPDELAPLANCTFVPTMGALHAGHTALIQRAAELGSPVVVSIFVNPTQFGPDQDFQRYPRQPEEDLAIAENLGVDAVFAPEVDVIYPVENTPETQVAPPQLPPVASEPGLEDAHRPGHFEGVCQVVARLFDLVRPRWAVFGEKDYQQLRVIEALLEQQSPRWGQLEIVSHPTVREADGLALSSRNVYLSQKQRKQALAISHALKTAQTSREPAAAECAMQEILKKKKLQIDYAVVRDAATLLPLSSFERPARALIAARVGAIRLIDNLPILP